MTIAELRRKSAYTLAERKDSQPNDAQIQAATRLMNSYYRLCGLCDRLLYLENDKRTCNRHSTKRAEERREKWSNRLNKQLSEYNACLEYFGHLPTICALGTTQDLYLTHFYYKG